MFDSLVALRHRLGAHGPWPRRILALACLVLAAGTALPGTVPARPGRSTAAVPTTAVVVARSALPAGRVLTPRDVLLRHYPSALAPVGALHSAAQVHGQRLTSATARGEPLTSTRLLGPGLAAHLPAGWVALTVPATGTDDFVRAGDRVDLVPATGSHGDVAATNVQVLAVLPARDDGADGFDGPQASADVVVAMRRSTALTVARARVDSPFVLFLSGP